jgi:hypothetical protein
VVTKGPQPASAGPWWLLQDLAHGGDLVVTVLRVSKLLGTVPVLDIRLLIDVKRVDQLAAWDVRVPIYANKQDAATNQSVREVRRLLRGLVAQNAEEAVAAAEAVATAVSDLFH